MSDVGLTTRTLLIAGHDRGWDVALYRTAEILHFTATRGGVCARVAWAGDDADASVQIDGWPTVSVTIPQVAAILAASDAVEGVVS